MKISILCGCPVFEEYFRDLRDEDDSFNRSKLIPSIAESDTLPTLILNRNEDKHNSERQIRDYERKKQLQF